jgi:hypothetical protein
MPSSGTNAASPLAAISPKPIKNAKSAVVTPAQNGFVVQMQKVDDYGYEYAVAKTLAEVSSIFEKYFNEEMK